MTSSPPCPAPPAPCTENGKPPHPGLAAGLLLVRSFWHRKSELSPERRPTRKTPTQEVFPEMSRPGAGKVTFASILRITN